jgi:hypothetical protein
VEALRQKYPWPAIVPDVPEDVMGWLCTDTAKALADRLSAETKLVVECGTWLGGSARWILENAPNAQVACVDTWKGSPEHHTNPDWARHLPKLYETCQLSLWPWRDRVVMLRQDSLVGLGEVFAAGCAAGVQPDLIYLDTKHTAGRVTAELYLCLELFPGAMIVGDDFNHAAVALAAREHAKLTGRPLLDCGEAFAFEPWRTF